MLAIVSGVVSRWFSRQVEEIAGDRVLRLYGVALAYVNVVTFFYWVIRRDAARVIGDSSNPICWPFWESCAADRLLSAHAVTTILWVYLVLSLATGLCFLLRRGVAWGYGGLVLVNAIRVGLVVQDFTLRLNQHYMANWVVLVFLLFPHRRILVPAILVSFYFWAGALKLDMEWLSGAALYNRDKLWMPEALVPASCVYVVVLEMVLVFGLYSRRPWVFWTTLFQLILFHVYSWPIVGFYYPLLMFGLLAMFPLARLLAAPDGSAQPSSAASRLSLVALLASFAFFQLLPAAFPGDTAITGEGRLFALHMFDARVVCEGELILHSELGEVKRISLQNRRYPTRIICDPILYLSLARNECGRIRRSGKARDLDLLLRSRRATQTELRTVVDLRDFCSAGVTYDLWRPNDWILK